MSNWISSFLIFFGTVFIFIASVGILRMPDLLMRMHAATKAGTLGVGLILCGVTIHFANWSVAIESVLTIAFIVITAPIASHLTGRASYFDGIQLSPATWIDELKTHYDSKTHHLKSAASSKTQIDK